MGERQSLQGLPEEEGGVCAPQQAPQLLRPACERRTLESQALNNRLRLSPPEKVCLARAPPLKKVRRGGSRLAGTWPCPPRLIGSPSSVDLGGGPGLARASPRMQVLAAHLFALPGAVSSFVGACSLHPPSPAAVPGFSRSCSTAPASPSGELLHESGAPGVSQLPPMAHPLTTRLGRLAPPQGTACTAG